MVVRRVEPGGLGVPIWRTLTHFHSLWVELVISHLFHFLDITQYFCDPIFLQDTHCSSANLRTRFSVATIGVILSIGSCLEAAGKRCPDLMLYWIQFLKLLNSSFWHILNRTSRDIHHHYGTTWSFVWVNCCSQQWCIDTDGIPTWYVRTPKIISHHFDFLVKYKYDIYKDEVLMKVLYEHTMFRNIIDVASNTSMHVWIGRIAE